jgi:hypothetical protein
MENPSVLFFLVVWLFIMVFWQHYPTSAATIHEEEGMSKTLKFINLAFLSSTFLVMISAPGLASDVPRYELLGGAYVPYSSKIESQIGSSEIYEGETDLDQSSLIIFRKLYWNKATTKYGGGWEVSFFHLGGERADAEVLTLGAFGIYQFKEPSKGLNRRALLRPYVGLGLSLTAFSAEVDLTPDAPEKTSGSNNGFNMIPDLRAGVYVRTGEEFDLLLEVRYQSGKLNGKTEPFLWDPGEKATIELSSPQIVLGISKLIP